MGVRDRRALRPRLERVEGRELLSGLIASMAASSPRAAAAFTRLTQRLAATSNVTTATGVNYSGNTGNLLNGNGLSNNTASPLLGNGQPSPHELARETFRAYFSGRYYVGPGRFTDQGITYYFRGIGGANWFLHGDFNMAVVTPADPSAPFQGEAVMQDKNTSTSAIQGFILTADRTSVDSLGRPTRLTFTADPNIFSGVFFAAGAEGTVDITYGRKNAVTVRFNGLVYTSGLTSPLVNQDLYARHNRPLRNHIPT
jgi:hypothetical protein